MRSDAVNSQQTVVTPDSGACPCTAVQTAPSSPFLGTTSEVSSSAAALEWSIDTNRDTNRRQLWGWYVSGPPVCDDDRASGSRAGVTRSSSVPQTAGGNAQTVRRTGQVKTRQVSQAQNGVEGIANGQVEDRRNATNQPCSDVNLPSWTAAAG